MRVISTTLTRALAIGAILVAATAGVTMLAAGSAHAATGTRPQAVAVHYQHGPRIVKLQRELGYLNYYESPVDGIYGPRTRTAVRDFQRNNGLTVDGIAGPRTIALIKQQMITGDSQMTANN
jgi:N-acetylmuramoyl-L-alanine amidase